MRDIKARMDKTLDDARMFRRIQVRGITRACDGILSIYVCMRGHAHMHVNNESPHSPPTPIFNIALT